MIVFEQPLWILVVGIVVCASAMTTWMNTGKKASLYIAVGGAVVTVGLLIAAWFIDTPRETLIKQLEEIRADVESNDLARVTRHIHPSATEMIAQVAEEYPRHKFHEVKITRIDAVEIDDARTPPQAVVNLRVMAKADLFGQQMPGTRFGRFFILTMEKDAGRWKLIDYEHHDIQQGLIGGRE